MSILIITSTVYVNSLQTVLTDPNIRLQQYIDSIIYYLNTKNIKKIIVCDNSGFDYSKITSINEKIKKSDKELELLNFQGNTECIKEFGKGYGEGEIMRFIFKNSKLIQGEEISFIKITGRLQIKNIDLVLQFLNPKSEYFQPVNLNPFIDLKKVDTRFYQCSKIVFQNVLENSYFEVDDKTNKFLEHVYYNKLKINKIKFKSFLVLPKFSGISGSTGIVYEMSNATFMIRQFIHLIFKSLFKR
jgi:hypothetical protein